MSSTSIGSGVLRNCSTRSNPRCEFWIHVEPVRIQHEMQLRFVGHMPIMTAQVSSINASRSALSSWRRTTSFYISIRNDMFSIVPLGGSRCHARGWDWHTPMPNRNAGRAAAKLVTRLLGVCRQRYYLRLPSLCSCIGWRRRAAPIVVLP